MVQFATRDDEEQKFWRIYQELAKQTLADIESYYKTAYQSPELGRIVYEEQLMPIYKVLEKSLFIKAYSQILEGEKTLGSVEAYLKILYAIFGKDAKITITQEPLHLKIDIIAEAQKFLLWVTKQNQQVENVHPTLLTMTTEKNRPKGLLDPFPSGLKVSNAKFYTRDFDFDEVIKNFQKTHKEVSESDDD